MKQEDSYTISFRMGVFNKKKPYKGRLTKRIKDIIESALYGFIILNLHFDPGRSILTVEAIRNKKIMTVKDAKFSLDYFNDMSADGWMEGDITINSKNDELDLDLIEWEKR
jgi:hypothetical protein